MDFQQDVYLKNIYLSTGNISATENIPERIAQVALTNKVPWAWIK